MAEPVRADEVLRKRRVMAEMIPADGSPVPNLGDMRGEWLEAFGVRAPGERWRTRPPPQSRRVR